MSADPQQHWLDIEQVGAVTVVRLLWAELVKDEDIATVGKRLLRIVDELGCKLLVFNLARVESLDSATIGKLLAVHKRTRALGGRVVLCAADPSVQAALQSLHLHRLLGLYATEQEAVTALAGAS
ncbi:MAG: STAS domain-containing protein [Gemmataceae bacterium]|nr:STAS domain-containing protein [Gemmataceae bacterium]